MATVGRWKAEWESKKKFFENESGKKKPSEKYLGFFRKSSGVSTAFAQMDQTYAKIGIQQGSARKQAIDAFAASIANAKKTGAAYTKILEAAIAKEDCKKQLQSLIKILIQDIDNCISSAKAQLTIEREVLGNESNPLAAAAASKHVKPMKALTKSTVKRALLWVAIQERKPDAKAFNAGIEKVARDITQNLENLRDNYPKGSAEYKKLERPLVPLRIWGDRGKKLSPDTRFEQVIIELSHLKKLISSIPPLLK